MDKDLLYFKRLLKSQTEQSATMMKTVKISDKAQQASYLVAKLIPKKMKPHTLAEEMLFPACCKIVRLFFGEEGAKEVSKIPHQTILLVDILQTCLMTLKNKYAKRYKIYQCLCYKWVSQSTTFSSCLYDLQRQYCRELSVLQSIARNY